MADFIKLVYHSQGFLTTIYITFAQKSVTVNQNTAQFCVHQPINVDITAYKYSRNIDVIKMFEPTSNTPSVTPYHLLHSRRMMLPA